MSWDHKGVRSRYYRYLKRKGLKIGSIYAGSIAGFKIYYSALVPTHKKGRKPDAKFDKKDPTRDW